MKTLARSTLKPTSDDGSCLYLDAIGVCGGDCELDQNENGVCDEDESLNCAADFDFMGAEFGISPNPDLGETFVDGYQNQYYTETIHIVLPANTSGIPDAPIELPMDSVVLDSIVLIGSWKRC